MPLSWNEIRDRAVAFSREWGDATSERAEAQSFWNDFFKVFGINRKRVAIFEKQVEIARAGKKLKNGRIDAFWKGVLLIEHKSADADLDRAFAQAADYFDGLAEKDLPRYILVSDFQQFRLFDIEVGHEWKFGLKDLHKHIKRFAFIAGYQCLAVPEGGIHSGGPDTRQGTGAESELPVGWNVVSLRCRQAEHRTVAETKAPRPGPVCLSGAQIGLGIRAGPGVTGRAANSARNIYRSILCGA